MKRWGSWLLLTLMLSAACGSLAEGAKDVTQLTEARIQLLVAMGASEARVRTGTTTSVERRVLEEADRGEAYLAARYGVSFLAVDCTVNEDGSSRDLMRMRIGDGPDQCRLFVDALAEGDQAFQDDYIGRLLAPSYAQMVEGLLPDADTARVWVDAALPYAYGPEYDPKATAAQILTSGLSLYAVTDIAVWGMDEAAFQAFAGGAEEALKAAKTGGTFIFRLLSREPGESESIADVGDLVRLLINTAV